MTKFITVTPKDSPKAHPWINVDHLTPNIRFSA